ncbi:hypothetical protein DCAR_0730113 [Daucus carota subsp. sativus]|uniref:Uncharacterized protein n=1 Tax=Daucus carota subsp. sativus TaxID=79200 RepID=A0A164UP07_DAUCS|nr:hypothetical protein DCAR_0730113 [Daucus carota subsp. sativus]
MGAQDGSRVIAAPEYCHVDFKSYFTDEFWQVPEFSQVTGPVSLASVGARNFLMHQTCFSWLSAKCSTGGVCINKILSKLLEEPHWFICHICGKDKAIVVCLSTWNTYHLLCVSKSFPQKLNMVNYTLLSDAWDFSEDDELQFSKVFWQNAMRGVFSSQRDNSYDLDYFLELEDKAWLTPTPSANLTTRKKVLLLTFYYIKGYGFVVHGLWIGELDAMGKGGVICLRNYVKADIKKEPLYNYVVGKISELPIDIIEEMKTYWFDKNGKVLDGKYLEFWIRQTLRHGVQAAPSKSDPVAASRKDDSFHEKPPLAYSQHRRGNQCGRKKALLISSQLFHLRQRRELKILDYANKYVPTSSDNNNDTN